MYTYCNLNFENPGLDLKEQFWQNPGGKTIILEDISVLYNIIWLKQRWTKGETPGQAVWHDMCWPPFYL